MEMDTSITKRPGVCFHLDQDVSGITIRSEKATQRGSVTIRSKAGGVCDWTVMGSRRGSGGEFLRAKRAMGLPLQGHEDLLS
jgi:hypothetical protein